jgi:hypothetical protein
MSPRNWSELEAFISRFYEGRKVLITPYVYPVFFAGVTQNATQTQTINIVANADFVLIGVRHRAWLAAAGQTVSTKSAPIGRLLLIDSGSNEQYTQAPVQLDNYSTNDSKILDLPYPRVIAGRTTLTAQYNNNSPAAETQNVEVALTGVQVRAYS